MIHAIVDENRSEKGIIRNMIVEISVGDVAQMRKKHPCGSFEWTITRVGVDIGMECVLCGRRVMIPRSKFNKRVKSVVERGQTSAENQS